MSVRISRPNPEINPNNINSNDDSKENKQNNDDSKENKQNNDEQAPFGCGDEVYEIDCCVGAAWNPKLGKFQYALEYTNYDETTWEPWVEGCEETIVDYWEMRYIYESLHKKAWWKPTRKVCHITPLMKKINERRKKLLKKRTRSKKEFQY